IILSMLNNALKACGSGSSGPSLLDLTREECLGLLRRKELRLYGDAVSVMRAQGALTEAKRDLLRGLRAALGVSETRHRCECRRAALDEELSAIADWVFGRDTGGDWREEGRCVVPALDWANDAAALTEAGRRADAVAVELRRKQQTANGSETEAPPAAMLKEQQQREPDRAKVKPPAAGRASKTPAAAALPSKPNQQLLSRATQRQEELLAAAEEFRRQLLASTSQQQAEDDQKDAEMPDAAAPAAAPACESNDDPLAQATAAAIAEDLVTLANVAVSALPPPSQPQPQAAQVPPLQPQQPQQQHQALSTPTRPPVLVQTSESVQTPIYIVAGPPHTADTGRGIQHQQQSVLHHTQQQQHQQQQSVLHHTQQQQHQHQPMLHHAQQQQHQQQPLLHHTQQQQQQQTVRVISRPNTSGFGKPVIVVQKPAMSGASKIVASPGQQPQLHQQHHQLLFATAPTARTQTNTSVAAASGAAAAPSLPVHGVDLDEEQPPMPPPQQPQAPQPPHMAGPVSSISMSMALTLAAASSASSNASSTMILAPTSSPSASATDWRASALDLLDRLARWPDSRRPTAGGLAGIRARLLAGEYRALEELDADVRLMKGAGAEMLAAYEAELAGLRDRLGVNNNNNTSLAPPGFKKRRYL
ncbi:hypothetical protein BOX15_Mlig023466g2, partial [Macrostomum lignano]